MNKVLVDRELLESALKTIHGLAPGRFTVEEELRAAVTAQPAEAEGVDAAYFEIWARSIEHPVLGWLGTNSFRRGDAPETYGDPYVQGAWVVYQRLSAGLSAVTAERDRLQRNLDFTEQWYAVRFERLADLGKSAGCWDAMAAIIANGTTDPHEPPTYAQQLVRANHRADVAEREHDQLRAEVEMLREDAERFRHIERDCDSGMRGIYGDDWVEVIDSYIAEYAAMAAKEA